jgi:hypothetical protein
VEGKLEGREGASKQRHTALVLSLRAAMADRKQKLVLSIVEFLQQSIQDGTVKQDDTESLEVASASL